MGASEMGLLRRLSPDKETTKTTDARRENLRPTIVIFMLIQGNRPRPLGAWGKAGLIPISIEDDLERAEPEFARYICKFLGMHDKRFRTFVQTVRIARRRCPNHHGRRCHVRIDRVTSVPADDRLASFPSTSASLARSR